MPSQKSLVIAFILALLVIPSTALSMPSAATANHQNPNRTSNDLARRSPPNLAFIEALSAPAVEANGFAVTLTNCAGAEIDAAITTCKNNNGGTVYLPACDVSLSDKVFRVPAGVSIIGSGRDSTIVRDAIFHFNGDQFGTVGDGISRFAYMSIINDLATTNYYFEVRRTQGMRIDHMYFEGRFSTFMNIILPSTHDDGYVVIDHCEFNLHTSYGFYTFGRNTYFENIGSTACRDLLGADNGSGGAVFVEDCAFSGFYDHLMDGRTGAHYIFRHNAIVYDSGSGPLEGHGPTTPGDDLNVGTNAIEIYDVTIAQNGVSGSAGILIRSGCGVVYNTTISNKKYGIAMAVENSPYNWPRDAASYPVYHQPHGLWFWNNTFHDIDQGEYEVVWNSTEAIQGNRDYFLRTPSQTLDGFTYTPYPYPHPLTVELNLAGRPANQAIHLNWTINTTLPLSTTWHIDYYTTTANTLTATDPVSTTRAYTLTDLTNYQFYTVTLSAMLDATAFLSDTVRVMPTDLHIYLPLAMK